MPQKKDILLGTTQKESLQPSEANFRDLLMRAPVAIVTYRGPSYIVETINEAALKMWGKTYEEVINKPFFEVSPETEESLKDIFNGIYTTGEEFSGNELPVPLQRAGKDITAYFNFTYQPLRTADNEITGVVGIASEVTEQVNARKIVEVEEQRFSMLAESIPNLAWMAYPDGNIFWYNTKWFEYTGTTLSEMQGWGWQSVHDPEILPHVLVKWRASIANGKPFDMVFPLKGADGRFRQFLTRVMPVYDSENNIYRWVGTNTDIQEQIESEEKIKQSEAKFRTLSETLPLMVWTATADAKKNFFNKYFLDYTGLSFEELKGDGMLKIIFPADLKKDLQLWQHSIKTGEDFKMEKRLRRHDGTYRWHLSHGVAQRDDHGNITGWIGSSTEIEEQRKFAETLETKVNERTYQLHIQNETFKQAEESSKQGSYSFNLTTGKLIYSDNLFRLIGYEPNEFEPSLEEFNQHVHPDDKDYVSHAAQKVVQSKTADEWHYRMITKTGSVINVKGTGRVIGAGDENLLVGTLQDATKEFELNKELQERESDLNRIISHAPDGVIVINEESIITLWNPKTEEIFGWRADEVLGLYLTDTIIPPQYRDAHKEGMKHYLKTGESRILNKTLELTALTKEGKEIPIALTISQATQRGNKLFIAFLKDITQEKNNKEELIVKTKQLLEINQTLELQNKELELSNAELTSFSYIASHDLQEPLRKIVTFSTRIQNKHEGELPTDVANYLSRIEAASRRMAILIQGLLDYSRLRQEKKDFAPTDLNETCKNVEMDFELLIEEKKACIECEKLHTIEANPLQLNQLFYNIISNALKFAKAGVPPVISISSRTLSEKEIRKHPNLDPQIPYYEIVFKDNGIGFDQKYSDKIFTIFQRLHPKGTYDGTGIGLALCKKIVENHHGEIYAEAKENKGAVFHVILPSTQPESVKLK